MKVLGVNFCLKHSVGTLLAFRVTPLLECKTSRHLNFNECIFTKDLYFKLAHVYALMSHRHISLFLLHLARHKRHEVLWHTAIFYKQVEEKTNNVYKQPTAAVHKCFNMNGIKSSCIVFLLLLNSFKNIVNRNDKAILYIIKI